MKTCASQTSTDTLGQIGATSASQPGVVFNAVKPGNGPGGANSISLDNLVLTIYNAAGAVLFNSGAFTPMTFSSTFNGGGQSGYLFKLDPAQVSAAQAAAFGSNFPANRIGLLASASNATSGPETFFLQADAIVTPPDGCGGGGSTGSVGGGTGNSVPSQAHCCC